LKDGRNIKHHKPANKVKIPIITLYLPRPGRIPEHLKKYFPRGGVYPLHFEPKIKKFVGTRNYLHVFGGASSTGLRVDLRPELKPDVVADAHYLPFRENCFDAVVLDPPYNDEFAKEMFGTPKLHEMKWINEAIRVCKPGGKIGIYHSYVMQSTKAVSYSMLVVTILRFRQFLRVFTVFTKLGGKTTKITDFCTGGGIRSWVIKNLWRLL